MQGFSGSSRLYGSCLGFLGFIGWWDGWKYKKVTRAQTFDGFCGAGRKSIGKLCLAYFVVGEEFSPYGKDIILASNVPKTCHDGNLRMLFRTRWFTTTHYAAWQENVEKGALLALP